MLAIRSNRKWCRNVVKAIEERFNRTHLVKDILLPGQFGKLRALFYQLGAVRNEVFNEDNSWSLKVELSPEKWQQLAARDDECGKFLHTVL